MSKRSGKRKTWFISVLRTLLILFACGVAAVMIINLWVVGSVSNCILSEDQAVSLSDVDCIVVLGCQVRSDGTPSHMLEDRLRRGVALYQQGAAPKLLMSGDHGTRYYNEVGAMQRYAENAGVPPEDLFLDHAGFSTYETIYRAKEIFGAKKILVVTQTYHLYRTMYIAKAIGMEVYGVPAEYRQYGGQFNRDIREILARIKDFGMTIFWPEPTYLGDAIPINGNGEQTHDRKSDLT